MISIMKSILGIIGLCIIGYLWSENKKKINYIMQLKLMLSSFLIALFFLKINIGTFLIFHISSFFNTLYQASNAGIDFLFGKLADPSMSYGFIFAVKVLPVIIFFSALISILNYLGIVTIFVEGLGKIFRPLWSSRYAETSCAIANSFLSLTEAPLLIKDYLSTMSESELFAVMVTGMGTISGSLIAVYGSLGIEIKHLLISSILSISSTLFFAKLFVPYENKNEKEELPSTSIKKKDHNNILDACAEGASSGLMMALNVGAMLLVIISLLGCINALLEYTSFNFFNIISKVFGYDINITLSLQTILGYLCYPFAWVIGISYDALEKASVLIGTKIAVNEMIAYLSMAKESFSTHDNIVLTYALCGFSNFSCIGILIGSIGSLIPQKRFIFSKYGIKAVFAAAFANIFNACIVNICLNI